MRRERSIRFPLGCDGINGITFTITVGGNLEVHLDDDPIYRRGVVDRPDIPRLIEFLSGRDGSSPARSGNGAA